MVPSWQFIVDCQMIFTQFSYCVLIATTVNEAFPVSCDRVTIAQIDTDNEFSIYIIEIALMKTADFMVFRIVKACDRNY